MTVRRIVSLSQIIYIFRALIAELFLKIVLACIEDHEVAFQVFSPHASAHGLCTRERARACVCVMCLMLRNWCCRSGFLVVDDNDDLGSSSTE